MQHAALLPVATVHRCLTPLTMRQLWMVPSQPIVDGGREVKMAMLLNWIRIASAGGAPPMGPPIQLNAPLAAPLADARLLGCLQHVLQRWLPGLVGAPTAQAQAGAPAPQIAGILQQFLDNQGTCHQADEAW